LAAGGQVAAAQIVAAEEDATAHAPTLAPVARHVQPQNSTVVLAPLAHHFVTSMRPVPPQPPQVVVAAVLVGVLVAGARISCRLKSTTRPVPWQ
jgi:hypothetical protein